MERAYLAQCLDWAGPVFGLVRTAFGYLLLDRAGMEALRGALPTRRGLLARLGAARFGPGAQRAETLARRHAILRAPHALAGARIARRIPAGAAYLSVGHGMLDPALIGALRARAAIRVAAMVHDVIPLQRPGEQAPGRAEQFSERLSRVRDNADLVLYPSDHSRRAAERIFDQWGGAPRGAVIPLGITIAAPDLAGLPAGLDLTRPYFVALGTIEPRKRHDLLLDLWDDMIWAQEAHAPPMLYIVGQRGWQNADVVRRLDALLPDDPVRELGPLPDGAVTALLSGARALLHPSAAEGFGLPPVEAACLGVPVLCQPLEVYGETLGGRAICIADRDGWRMAIGRLTQHPDPQEPMPAPGWAAHFNSLLSRL
ncbi:MAG: glycosyltransferase [Marinibacterium sp.]|nr:glycosyltransferase [Marinibacterium sp.]